MDLLFPSQKKPCMINNMTSALIEDIRLDKIARAMALRQYALSASDLCELFTDNPDTILYRNAVIRDMIANPAISESFSIILPMLYKMKEQLDTSNRNTNEIRKPIYLYHLLQNYIVVTDKLIGALNYPNPCVALKFLRNELCLQRSDKTFIAMEQRLNQLDLQFLNTKSLTCGISFAPGKLTWAMKNGDVGDHRNYTPKLLDLREYRIEPLDQSTVFEPINIETAGLSKIKPLSSVLFEELENVILDDFIHSYKKQYDALKTTISNRFNWYQDLIKHIEALRFYLSVLELFNKLEGHSICFAEIANDFEAEGLYSLNLALDNQTEPVTNDISLSSCYHILTGANNSGKTEFLITVSQAQFMFQIGMFVPAKKMRIGPVAYICTLFMGGENSTYTDSRMGEELERFKSIMQLISSQDGRCMVMLNEPMTSTSAIEGVQICSDMVNFLIKKSACGIIVTHYYDLYEKLVEEGQTQSVSLVMVTKDEAGYAKHTFKVAEKLPEYKSYALEIADRLGITIENFAHYAELKNINFIESGAQQ